MGFPLYDLITLMLSLVKGTNVNQPSQGTHGATNATLSFHPDYYDSVLSFFF